MLFVVGANRDAPAFQVVPAGRVPEAGARGGYVLPIRSCTAYPKLLTNLALAEMALVLDNALDDHGQSTTHARRADLQLRFIHHHVSPESGSGRLQVSVNRSLSDVPKKQYVVVLFFFFLNLFGTGIARAQETCTHAEESVSAPFRALISSSAMVPTICFPTSTWNRRAPRILKSFCKESQTCATKLE